MFVKCKCHGEKKDKDTLFKISINGKNEYYCNEKEYLKIKENKDCRTNIINFVNELFGYIITNTIWFKELSELEKSHTYTKIFSYLIENKSQLEQYMNKQFSSEFGKIKYFTTILRNNLSDYKIIEKKKEFALTDDIIDVCYKSKNKKKCLSDYINEME